MFKNILLVALGGALGSTCRYLVSLINFNFTNKIYINTLITNVLGCFLIGFLLAYLTIKTNNVHLNLLLVTGFCGGFTTFSTFALENQKMMQSNQILEGLIYIILSVILCITSVFLGQKTAQELII